MLTVNPSDNLSDQSVKIQLLYSSFYVVLDMPRLVQHAIPRQEYDTLKTFPVTACPAFH